MRLEEVYPALSTEMSGLSPVQKEGGRTSIPQHRYSVKGARVNKFVGFEEVFAYQTR